MSVRPRHVESVDSEWLLQVGAAVLAALLLFPSTAVAALVNPIKLFNEHRESVVRIVTVNASGQLRVGCGLVLLESGTIATAHELFKNVAGARVELADGTVFEKVTMLGTDGVVALLKVDAMGLRRLSLSDSGRFPNGTNGSVI